MLARPVHLDDAHPTDFPESERRVDYSRVEGLSSCVGRKFNRRVVLPARPRSSKVVEMFSPSHSVANDVELDEAY